MAFAADVRLENRLYPPQSDLPTDERPQPDRAMVHRELRRPSVTLMLLWEEYCDTTSDGFSYSWFCERYKGWAGRLKLTLRLVRLMTMLERTNLIIIDDWGPEPLTAEQAHDLLGIADDRYDKGSLLITSQVPVAQWHDIIANPTLGDAILDRVIHNAHRIELNGDSLRRRADQKRA